MKKMHFASHSPPHSVAGFGHDSANRVYSMKTTTIGITGASSAVRAAGGKGQGK